MARDVVGEGSVGAVDVRFATLVSDDGQVDRR
jgi:hypothetical protein